MASFSRLSPGEECTRALAGGIAHVLRGGDTVALSGDLGAGKTTVARAIAAALGVGPLSVSSPTFALVNQYDVPPSRAGPGGIEVIAHIDAYRLGDRDDLESLGWDRYFGGRAALGGVLALIEWPERIGALCPDPALRVAIEAEGPSVRRFTIDVPDAWISRPGAGLLAEREPIRCPVTGAWVSPTCSTYPFVDDRARLADLHRWFSGRYRISREVSPEDRDGS